MQKLFTILNKDIYDINTTILYTSEFNYTSDAIELLHSSCQVIDKNGNYDPKEIPKDIIKYFNCEYLLKKDNLSKIDKIKISILNSLDPSKNIFVFLNVLTYVDSKFKEDIISFLKNNNKRIINYTSEIEETLLLEYLIVIHDNKVIMEGNTKEVLKEEKILKKLGFNMPFIVELSCGLKYYGLVDKIYYKNESLVDDLWK